MLMSRFVDDSTELSRLTSQLLSLVVTGDSEQSPPIRQNQRSFGGLTLGFSGSKKAIPEGNVHVGPTINIEVQTLVEALDKRLDSVGKIFAASNNEIKEASALAKSHLSMESPSFVVRTTDLARARLDIEDLKRSVSRVSRRVR